MRTSMLALVLAASCASIPLVEGPAHPDVGAGLELDACVVWGERIDRRRYEGVAELSLEPWHQAIVTIVLNHPTGIAVIDPAFGTAIADDLRRVPPWFRLISGSAKGKQPLVDGLRSAGIDPAAVRVALLTHAHWDHTGALRDLPNAWVRMSLDEYRFVEPLTRYLSQGAMPHHFEGVWPRVTAFELTGPPVLRFEGSKDVFHDGSVIAVPLQGHTPGSTGYLVRGRGGRRWLFTGDATWTVRGIDKPAHKLLSLIDHDRGRTGESIGRLHQLKAEHPEIAIVPAHDADALELLPTCAASE